MQVTPLQDFVLIKRKEEEKKSASGLLHIPASAQEKSAEGTVLAVGPGRVTENGTLVVPNVKILDKVLFNKHNFVEISVENEHYILVREDQIMVVLHD